MNAVSGKSVVRQITARLAAVTRLPKAALFHLLNGSAIQQMLDLGQLVTVNTILDSYGVGDDFKDGYRSWTGRSIAAAYRRTHRFEPLKAWVQHRTTGRWIHANVYVPGDIAIATGLRGYSRTAHLVPAPRAMSEVA